MPVPRGGMAAISDRKNGGDPNLKSVQGWGRLNLVGVTFRNCRVFLLSVCFRHAVASKNLLNFFGFFPFSPYRTRLGRVIKDIQRRENLRLRESVCLAM